MSYNYLLTLSYDGTPFWGWQKTPDGPSIEQHLSEAVGQIFQDPLPLQAASRTDRGVHADAQVVNFISSAYKEPQSLLFSLNALLPKEIRVLECKLVPLEFHPTVNVVAKEYHYHICLGRWQAPKKRHYSWHVPTPLNLEKMEEGAKQLEGRHDFSAFCLHPKREDYSDCVRTLFSITLHPEEEGLCIKVVGDHFFYKMVRALVGSLVDLGRGRLEEIAPILEGKNRQLAGVTAPSHGLTLKKVFYPDTMSLYDWKK